MSKSTNIKYIDIQITEEHLGLIVEITDTGGCTPYPEVVKISNLNNGLKDGKIQTTSLSGENSYRIKEDGKWGENIDRVDLGITKIFTREENPEYYL